jgi:CheY-like chemotaxis protein
MANALTELGHKVFSAYSVSDANSYLDEEKIDCIIVDLNMPTNGLSQGEVELTNDGLLTGWIWLHEYVLKEKPNMKERTIIYTEYMSELRAKISNNELEGILIISKKGPSSPALQIIDHLNDIEQKMNKRGR